MKKALCICELRAWVLAMFVAAGFGLCADADAQVAAPRPAKTRPAVELGYGFELDLEHLLDSDQVFGQSVKDPVWDMKDKNGEAAKSVV